VDALRLALWGWGEDRAETEGSPYEGEAQWTPSVSSSEAGGEDRAETEGSPYEGEV